MKPFSLDNVRSAPIVNIWGETGTRKTSLAATFPSPQYWFVFDVNSPPTISYLVRHKLMEPPVGYAEYFLAIEEYEDPQKGAAPAKKLYKQFKNDLDSVLNSVDEGTIVIDTETKLWQLDRWAFLYDNAEWVQSRKDGKMYLMRTSYEKPNQMYEGLLDRVAFEKKRLGLVMISTARNKYDSNGQETAVLEAQRHSRLGYMVGIDLQMERHLSVDAKSKERHIYYTARIHKFDGHDDEVGNQLRDPAWEDLEEIWSS